MTILPADIEAEIASKLAALEEATEQYGIVVEQHGEAKVAYDSAFARAFVDAKYHGKVPDGARGVSDEMAERLAMIECEKLAVEVAGLDARAKRLREFLTTYRGTLDSLRTLAANTRELVK